MNRSKIMYFLIFRFWIIFLSFLLVVCSGGQDNKKIADKGSDSQLSATGESIDSSVMVENSQYEIVVYKSPTCGCCESWNEALTDLGYRLTVHSSDEQLREIKRSLNINPALQSCHTALVEGYVLEGHVHPDSIARLLRERENIRGLYLPGMVPNSVGMEQPGTDPVRYAILAVDYDDQKKIYDVYQ